MTGLENRTLLSRSQVSSMTCGCTCPIYYQGVVNVEKGSVIIRSKLAELIKKVGRGTGLSLAGLVLPRGELKRIEVEIPRTSKDFDSNEVSRSEFVQLREVG
jgi:hypothetical protein